jgi:NADP-dependent aldehyde dehydrogenase
VAQIVTAALRDAGLPAGAFAVIHGVTAGTVALQDPRVRAAAFTGSVAGGRALFDLASGRPDPIPFYGELGSINPVVVTPRAVAERRDAIADGLVASFTQGVGQFCTKPGLVFVPAGSGLTEAVTERVAGTTSAPMLGPRLRDAFTRGRDALTGADGVRELASGSAAPDAGAWAQPVVYGTDTSVFQTDPERLRTECFGPATVLVEWADADDLKAALRHLEGSLTATIHAAADDDEALLADVLPALTDQAGRVIWNGWPTGVAVTWAMQHGGPYPSSTAAQTTSVGSASVARFLRPVSYQDLPDRLLPPELQEANPLGIVRRVDGVVTLP